MIRGLDYKDIHLVPENISGIQSRDDVDINVEIFNEKVLPILAAPMPDVCDGHFCAEYNKLGGLGFIHRFQSIEEQESDFLHCRKNAGCAIGINEDWQKRFETLYKSGCRIFLIDVANGASRNIQSVANIIKKTDSWLVTGNIASINALKFSFNDLGADAVRVGIAGGSVCSTKYATGIYTPMFSTLLRLYEYKNIHFPTQKIIADGGIKTPADLCKAMCVADIAMAGGIFAGTEESPNNPIRSNDGKLVKIFRGAASYSTQKFDNNKHPKYVEGMESLIPYTGKLSNVIDTFIGGLRSCLSYMNAKNLNELKKNYNYVLA